MATKLDQQSRVIGYWINLGRQFGITGEKLKEIEYGQSNPTLALMEYLYSKQVDNLTVGRFYEKIKEKLKRADVLKKLDPFLVEDSDKPMEDVIQLDSDVYEKHLCLSQQPKTQL
ncbi:hypothetical protein OS493_005805 [Desmophyllum pertusum]|uniref:Uncharacterized protein n=1 Tax=Desmophyllum pertusum TaxID=174260 RepID=A0A9W9YFE3_9CNID|nr:hypothetical protein OS493_005805 [Desmophyllum pertusum]